MLNARSFRKKRGVAVIELVMMLTIFIFVIISLYGSWGVIHSGILNSIAARSYAFVIINNRSNLNFLHEFSPAPLENNYHKYGIRYFATTQQSAEDTFIARTETIDIGGGSWSSSTDRQRGILGFDVRGGRSDDWTDLSSLGRIRPNQRNTDIEKRVIKLKQAYGICLNSKCNS